MDLLIYRMPVTYCFLKTARDWEMCWSSGLATDKAIRKRKGKNRPVLNQNIRLKTIDSLKPVDYTFLNTPSGRDMLSQLNGYFNKLKPNFYVINEDAFDIEYRKKISEKNKVKLVILKRTCPSKFEFISTSKIINKIKNTS